MLQDAILNRIQARLKAERLPIALKLWNDMVVTGESPAKITLSLNSPAVLSLLKRPSIGALAERYISQQIDVQGNIRDVVALLSQLFNVTGRAEKRLLAWAGFRRHSQARDAHAIQFHYDLSNEFYALWLDQRRVYSCAYFKHPNDGLDLAQEHKLDHICRKLQLQSGDRFLDIGCGWGGLILWAVQHYGADCVGITLSRNQYDYVRQQIDALGLSARCQVRLMDYRELSDSASFDKIASVGMFEHVGVSKLPGYFKKIYDLLKPGGIALNHGVTSATFDGEAIAGGGIDFIDRYVFPDGELTHLSKVIETLSRQRLECLDVECLRPHYAKTLWHWVERLDARQDEARALVGEKTYRIWRAYMAGFAHAFEQGWDSIYQIVAAKPLPDGIAAYPLTREHVYR